MAKSRKRQGKRVPKENRKNLRLWAQGAREAILAPHMDNYSAALDQGWVFERKYWKTVCREYHVRIPWRTEDHEEPMLGEWNPAIPIEKETLTPEDEVLKNERVKLLNKRIHRWFVYRIRRNRKHRSTAGLDPTKDPYAVLLAKLSGLSSPPKARQAFQQFMHESYAEKIAPVVLEKWTADREASGPASERTKEPKAGFRAQVAREVFGALPLEEQKALGERAKAEAKEAKDAYLKSLRDPPSQTPEARQRCISAVGSFVGPILQGLNASTGLHATLMLGGPMPAYGGEIRSLHYSFGRNNTPMSHHWAQWDKSRFARDVQEFMVEYLHTAFTPQDCANAALPDTGILSTAKYTFAGSNNNVSDDSDSDSDSDSDLDSHSDEGSDSDDDEAARPHKKAKLANDVAPPKRKKATKTKAKTTADSSTASSQRRPTTNSAAGAGAPPADSSQPHPANSAAGAGAPPADSSQPLPSAPVYASTAAPSQLGPTAVSAAGATTNASDLPPDSSQTPRQDSASHSAAGGHGQDDIGLGDSEGEEEEDEDEDEPERPARRGWWDTTEDERQQNIRRNKALLEELKLKEDWKSALAPLAKARSTQPRPRPRREAAPAAPTRRSTRHGLSAPVPVDASNPATLPAIDNSNDLPSLPATDVPASTASAPLPVARPVSTSASVGASSAASASGALSASAASTSVGAPPASTLAPLSQAVQVHVAMTPTSMSLPRASSLIACPTKAPAWRRCSFKRTDESSEQIEAEAGRDVDRESAGEAGGGPDGVKPPGVWWDSLQPKWRKKGADGKWCTESGYGERGREWGPLYQ
ncbi:hypothetical protein DFH06DRAFT_1125309 [Mycena polygramma]|nr:hypothetical protein DFH06DRAFT_1125309 [Mycena polygramma]